MEEQDTLRFIPLSTAAEQLQTTPLHLLMHVKRGVLVGRETPDGWQVDADSLAVLVLRRADGEGVSVCASTCGKAGGCSSCGQ